MSLKDQAVSSVFWVFIHAFGSQGIAFFVSFVLARFLEPSEFGLIAMLSVFIAIGNNLINSGLTQSLIRSQQVDEEDFSTVFYFNIIVSIIVYVLIFFLAPYIALFYNEEQLTNVVRIYSFSFIINAFSSVQSARLTKMLDLKTQMKVSFPSIIIGGISGILLAYNGYGVWSLVWSSLIQTFLSTIQLWYWSKWKPLFVFRIIKFKSHFQYGVNLTFSGILDALFTEVQHEYNITCHSELVSASKFDTIVLGVAHKEFVDLNLTPLLNENGVVYDVKGNLKHCDGKL